MLKDEYDFDFIAERFGFGEYGMDKEEFAKYCEGVYTDDWTGTTFVPTHWLTEVFLEYDHIASFFPNDFKGKSLDSYSYEEFNKWHYLRNLEVSMGDAKMFLKDYDGFTDITVTLLEIQPKIEERANNLYIANKHKLLKDLEILLGEEDPYDD